MSNAFRRPLFAFTLGAAIAAAVLLGRAAYADNGTIEACFKPSNGTLYLLGASSGRTECQPRDIPISWNAAGLNGEDGVSVTSEQLAPGDDPACPNGGSRFTSASGVTYACSGADGQDGQDGADGQDGEDFAGTFTSPNGQYSLSVSDTGIRLEGPIGRLHVLPTGVTLESALGLTLRGQTAALLLSSNFINVQAAGHLAVNGGQIALNGSGCGVLRPTDVAPAVGPGGGPVLLIPGSPTVRTGC
jgi:hypothetical protein